MKSWLMTVVLFVTSSAQAADDCKWEPRVRPVLRVEEVQGSPSEAEPSLRSQLQPLAGAGVPIVLDAFHGDAEGDEQRNDPRAVVDLVSIAGGTNGVATKIVLKFSNKTTMDQVGGEVYLDTDQSVRTGQRPSRAYGLRSQDQGMGFEYLISLFPILDGAERLVIYDQYNRFVGAIPYTVAGQEVSFEVPLNAVNDDGNMTFNCVVGDRNGPTDWAPEKSGLAIYVVGAWFLPGSSQLAVSQTWDLAIAIGNPRGLHINSAVLYVDGKEFTIFLVAGPDRPLPVQIIAVGEFGRRLGKGGHKVTVALFTGRGIFVEEASYLIADPFPPVPPLPIQPQ